MNCTVLASFPCCAVTDNEQKKKLMGLRNFSVLTNIHTNVLELFLVAHHSQEKKKKEKKNTVAAFTIGLLQSSLFALGYWIHPVSS